MRLRGIEEPPRLPPCAVLGPWCSPARTLVVLDPTLRGGKVELCALVDKGGSLREDMKAEGTLAFLAWLKQRRCRHDARERLRGRNGAEMLRGRRREVYDHQSTRAERIVRF